MKHFGSLIHSVDPFGSIQHPAPGYVPDDHPAFARLINEIRPTTIIEVGSWLGGSAIAMGRACVGAGLETEIICVDTWLGSVEHWYLEDERWGKQHLKMTGGYPGLYFSFAGNIQAVGLANYITPLPLDSRNAALLLKHHNVQADVVYIDAAHDLRGAMDDIEDYWHFLRPGGVMLGDDYHNGAPGVIDAANGFASRNELTLEVDFPKFIIRKPHAEKKP